MKSILKKVFKLIHNFFTFDFSFEISLSLKINADSKNEKKDSTDNRPKLK